MRTVYITSVLVLLTASGMAAAAISTERSGSKSRPNLSERDTALYTLPQNAKDALARAAAIEATKLGFTYGPAVAGGPYYPAGVLGVAKAAADSASLQLEVAPELLLAGNDSVAAAATGLLSDKV